MYRERECVCVYTLDMYHTVFYLLYSYGEFVCTYSCSEFLLKIFSSFAECACILRTLLDDGARICRTIFFFYYKSWKLKNVLLGLRSAIFVQKSAPVFCFHLNDPFAIVLWIGSTNFVTVVCCMFLSRLHGSCLMLDSLVWFFVTEIAKPCASSSSMTPKKKFSNFSTLAHWAENVFVVCFWADFWWKKIRQQLVAVRLRVNGPISLVEVLISGCVAAGVVFVCLLLPRLRTDEEPIQPIRHRVLILGFRSGVESWAHWWGVAGVILFVVIPLEGLKKPSKKFNIVYQF